MSGSRWYRLIGAGALALALLDVTVTAHGTAQTPAFRASTEAVRIDALVLDGRVPVTGLSADDFEVRDNGVLQRVTILEPANVPIRLLVALDVSGSVSGEQLAAFARASVSILDSCGPRDTVTVFTFSHRVDVIPVARGGEPSVQAAIAGAQAGGATALYDAVAAAMLAASQDVSRTALVILSDGDDTASWLSATDALALVERSDLVAYPVVARPTPPLLAAELSILDQPNGPRREQWLEHGRFLDALANVSGGRVSVTSSKGEDGALAEALNDLRRRYVLSYEPEGVEHGRAWHRLEVKAKKPGYKVQARRGYLAGP